MLRRTLLAGLATAVPSLALAQTERTAPKAAMTRPAPKSAYATVNGLKTYYEIHGAGGVPLVVLHGGFMNTESMGPLLPALAQGRQVIAVDLEGHGRTADLDRPLSTDQMGEDVSALIGHLGLGPVDVLGFSMGGMVAQRVAVKHANLVRKLVLISTNHGNDAYPPAVTAMWPGMSPEGLKGTPMEEIYLRVAPDPKHWPAFVEKMKTMMIGFQGWPKSDLQAIKAPTLLMLGDADLVRLDYAVEMFKLLGGARPDGGMGGLPPSRLAVLPGTTHFDILDKLDLLMPIIVPFLDPPATGV